MKKDQKNIFYLVFKTGYFWLGLLKLCHRLENMRVKMKLVKEIPY